MLLEDYKKYLANHVWPQCLGSLNYCSSVQEIQEWKRNTQRQLTEVPLLGDFNPPQETLETFSGRILLVTTQLEQIESFADTDIKSEIQKFTDLTTTFTSSLTMLGESKVVLEKSSD